MTVRLFGFIANYSDMLKQYFQARVVQNKYKKQMGLKSKRYTSDSFKTAVHELHHNHMNHRRKSEEPTYRRMNMDCSRYISALQISRLPKI